MFIIPDVIRGLSHILQFRARRFPREFPYLYKKNKHHRCINPKTDRLRSTNHQSQLLPPSGLHNKPGASFPPPLWVPKSKPRLCLFAFGRAEVRVAFNDRAERYRSCNLVTERDKPRFICLLWGKGKRRYELLSMIEQSDIIRATSLPNARHPLNTTYYFAY